MKHFIELCPVLFIVNFSYNLIAATYSSGSGCAVSSNTILTAYHVVKGSNKISVEFGNTICSAEIDSLDEEADWAILETKTPLPNIVQIAPTNHAYKIGDHIYTLGYPTMSLLGRNIKYSEGTISSLTGLRGDHEIVQISAPIQPGNSGGPMFSEDGMLIGIVTSTVNPGTFSKITHGAIPQNINFALRISAVHARLKTVNNVIGKIPIQDNQAATCLIIAASKTQVPDIKRRFLPKADPGQGEESRPNLGAQTEDDNQDVISKQIKLVTDKYDPAYQQIAEYLKGFRPDMCQSEDGSWGPITNESAYVNQLNFLDDLLIEAHELHQKYEANGLAMLLEDLSLKRIPSDYITGYWCAARESASRYFTEVLRHGDGKLPDTLLGITLGKPLVDVQNNKLSISKTLWDRIKNRFKKSTAHLPEEPYVLTASSMTSGRHIQLPGSRHFFGCNKGVIIEDNISKNVLGIILYIELNEPFFDPVASETDKVLKTFETRFNFRFYPAIERDEYSKAGCVSLYSTPALDHTCPESPCQDSMPMQVEAYYSQCWHDYTTKLPFGYKCPFKRTYPYCYESDGRRIEIRSLLKGREEPKTVLEIQYFLTGWEKIVEQTMKEFQKNVRRNNQSLSEALEDMNVL